MPPAVSGETMPAASPTSRTRSRANLATRPPTGIRPARGEPDLRQAADARHNPADVARSEPGIEETVQAIGIDSAYTFVFCFDAEQEGAIARQAEGARNARLRAVRTDEIANARAGLGEHHIAGVAARSVKRTAVAQFRARAACLRREPAHQRGRVRRQKVIPRGGEIDARQRWRVKPHAANALRQTRRHFPSLGGLLHEQARRADHLSRARLAFENEHR